MEEFVELYDEQKLKDYFNKIRNEILNGIDDLIKENDDLFISLIRKETHFLYDILKEFSYSKEKEEVKKLDKLFEIYKSLENIILNNYHVRKDINHIKSLVNGN